MNVVTYSRDNHTMPLLVLDRCNAGISLNNQNGVFAASDEGTSFLDWFSYCYSSTVGKEVEIKTTMFAMLFVTRPEIRYQLSPKMLRSLMKKLGSNYLSELLQLEEIFQGHMCLINDHFEELKDRRKDVVDVVRDRLSWKEFSVDWGGDYILHFKFK